MDTLQKHPRIEIYEGHPYFRCQCTGELVVGRIGLPSFLVLKRNVTEDEANDIYGVFANWNVLYRWLQDKTNCNEIPREKYHLCTDWMISQIGAKTFPKLVPANAFHENEPGKHVKDYKEIREPCFGTAVEEYVLQERLKDKKNEKAKRCLDIRRHLFRKNLALVRSYHVTVVPDLCAVHIEEVDVEPGLGLEWIREISGCPFEPTPVRSDGVMTVSSKPNEWNKRQQSFIKRLQAPKKPKRTPANKKNADMTKPPFAVSS